MTGNTSKWRAPLAGLASVAMLATMGVAASTANAASGAFDVKIYTTDEPYQVAKETSANWGDVLDPNSDTSLDPYFKVGDGKVFDYFSYDKAGNEKVGDVLTVKGDTKVFAQYKKAVKVSFDFDGDKTVDASVDVPSGTALTRAEYQQALAAAGYTSGEPTQAGDKFAGLTYTYTQYGTSDDLYTNKPFTADTTLYGRYDSGQNLAEVAFRNAGKTWTSTAYTLADGVFPEYRAPKTANWKVEGALEGANYDFTKAVANSNKSGVDLTLVAPDTASLKTVTVKYDFGSGVNATKADYETTADEKPVQPVEPLRTDAVFTGWFTYDGKKIDFSKSIADQANFNASTNEITLHAGWDTTHWAKLQYNLKYNDFTSHNGGQQFEYVYAGSKHDLPAGLEEYYVTDAQADAAKGEYSSKKLTGWYYGSNDKDVVTSVTAPSATNTAEYTAVWAGSYSVLLNGNGGKFGSDTYKWVTGAEGQKLSDVLVKPVRSGYTFQYWAASNGNKVNTTDLVSKWESRTLKAVWKATAKLDVAALRGQFGVKFKNAAADQLTVEAYGYTADSAKAYVEAVNDLEDEYAAYKALDPTSQAAVDAAEALAPKYEAAQKLLVKSNGAEVPSGKVAVYRAFNPNEKRAGSHLYTTSFEEYSALVRKGWTAEGVQFYTTSSKDATPLYRLYNKNDGSHHYTTSLDEKNALVKAGWTYEDIAWYVDSSAPASVWRAYNKNSGEHVYTIDENEYKGLTENHGWTAENEAFKAWTK